MTDRELIERAAEAANIKGKWGREFYAERSPGFMRPGWRRAWDPLCKDEDAMPLMVRLSMSVAVECEDKTVVAVFYGGVLAKESFTDPESAEVATRRAIVRCAALACDKLKPAQEKS